MRPLQALDLNASYGPNSPGRAVRRVIDLYGTERLSGRLWELGQRAVDLLKEAVFTSEGESFGVHELSGAFPLIVAEARKFLDEVFFPDLLEMHEAGLLDTNVDSVRMKLAWDDYDFSYKAELFVRVISANGLALYETQDFVPFVQRISAAALLLSLDDAVIAEFLDGRGLDEVIAIIESLRPHMERPANLFATIDSAKSMERANTARSGAIAKLANDPKQAEKASVRECWEVWQKEPSRYKSKAAFSKDMLGKFESLESQRVIERWCKEWESLPS